MSESSNAHSGFAGIDAMTVGDLAILPAATLASLKAQVEQIYEEAHRLDDKLDAALDYRYGPRAHQARAAQEKDTGTVRFEDNGFIVVADLPKRVKWNQQRLKELVDLIQSGWGENPADYVKVSQREDGSYVLDEKSASRRLVCQAGNPFGLPAKDRSGRLGVTEPPDLGAVLARMNGTAATKPAPANPSLTHSAA